MDIIMVSVETVGDFYIKADDRLQQSIKRGDVLGTTFHRKYCVIYGMEMEDLL